MQPEANEQKRRSKTAEAKARALRDAAEVRTPMERMAYALYLGRRGREFAKLAQKPAADGDNG